MTAIDILGLVLSFVSIISPVCAAYMWALPNTRISALFVSLEEVERIIVSALEDGLGDVVERVNESFLEYVANLPGWNEFRTDVLYSSDTDARLLVCVCRYTTGVASLSFMVSLERSSCLS